MVRPKLSCSRSKASRHMAVLAVGLTILLAAVALRILSPAEPSESGVELSGAHARPRPQQLPAVNTRGAETDVNTPSLALQARAQFDVIGTLISNGDVDPSQLLVTLENPRSESTSVQVRTDQEGRFQFRLVAKSGNSVTCAPCQ